MKLPSTASLAASVLVLLTGPALSQVEGTLFTEAAEREYLDALRLEFLRNNAEEGFHIEETTIPDLPEDAAAEPAGPVEFTFEGVMTRSDGSRDIWLNGRVMSESELPPGFSVVTDGRNTSLRIAQDGDTFVLQPGQTVDLTSGTVVENSQRSPPETQQRAPAEQEARAGQDAALEAEVEDAAGQDTTSEDDSTEQATTLSSATPETTVTGSDPPTADAAVSPEPATEPMTPEARANVVADALAEMSEEDIAELVQALERMQVENADDDP